MKHTLKITLILLTIFLLAQFMGIATLYKYIDPLKSTETGETTFKELPFGERPPIDEETSYLPILLAILIGTGLLLLLIKFKLIWIWKGWFLIAIFIALLVSFTAFMKPELAFLLALIFAFWKIFKPNIWIQNLTEIFIYGGLAAIFVPMLNLFSVSILLILISIYDAYAVWKSKHMITLAKSQAKAKVFAGLLIPYQLGKMNSKEKKIKQKIKKSKKSKVSSLTKSTAKITAKTKTITKSVHTAILGGGDIAFPLIFAGVILKEMGLWQSLIIPFFALAGLAVLFWKAEEKKFYPAMPFISAGCFIGLGVVWLINFLI